MDNKISLSDNWYTKSGITICELCNRPLGESKIHLDCRVIGVNAAIYELKVISEWLIRKKITHVETVIEHIDQKLEGYKLEAARIGHTQERTGNREL